MLTDYQSTWLDEVMSARRSNLSGKRILVTGASSGIGYALAVRLAAKGAHLVLAARREALLSQLAGQMGTPTPVTVATDLSVPGAARELADAALEALGGVDIVVNNAGANVTGAQLRFADGDEARRVFEVNVWSPLALTAAVLPAMLAAGEGTIVNVTSTIQSVPLPLLGYYSASKAALAQATRSLRLELADTGIRVLEVIPGATDTALRDIDELPWKTSAPRTLPPVTPESTACAIVDTLERGATRLVYPRYVLAPLEIPAIGRLIARIGGRQVNTRDALRPV
jgi:short-subunit dehydrogenase